MFAFSITFKLLSWYLALKFGDEGPAKRPWILGIIVGGVFGIFDFESNRQWTFQQRAELGVFYLIAAIVLMNIYHRVQNIALSLLIGAIGTAILFFGVPISAAVLFDAQQSN
jgi:hypothetical protein